MRIAACAFRTKGPCVVSMAGWSSLKVVTISVAAELLLLQFTLMMRVTGITGYNHLAHDAAYLSSHHPTKRKEKLRVSNPSTR